MTRTSTLILSFSLLIFVSCKVSESLSLDSTNVAPSKISKSERFSVDAKHTALLGIGTPSRNELMRDARRELSKSYPGTPERNFANAVVNYTKTNYGIVTVANLHAEGDLILEWADKSSPAPPKEAGSSTENLPGLAPNLNSPQQASADRPHFIINSRMRNTDWEMIQPWIPTITGLRIPGGSVSQYTWGDEAHVPAWLMADARKRRQQTIITTEEIDGYKNFIDGKDVETYFCLNINDALQNQLDLIDRFRDAEIEFTHVEIGNETYLPKFRKEKKAGLGFVRKIDYTDYVKLLDEWIPSLRNYPFKILVVAASVSNDGSRGDIYRNEWNNAVLDYIAKNPGAADGIALHIYQGNREDSPDNLEEEVLESDNYSFADQFPLPLHITEGGHRGVDWSPEGIELYKTFHRNLYLYLQSRNDGSRYGTHVLYNPRNQPNHPFPLYDPNGITPLGEAAREFPFTK
ncbi:MAG: hypothetical protein ABR572_05605 [Cryomorphaceae bacterium]